MPAQALVQTLRLAGMQGLAIKTSNKSPDILALSRLSASLQHVSIDLGGLLAHPPRCELLLETTRGVCS